MPPTPVTEFFPDAILNYFALRNTLLMAKAHHKARPPVTERFVTIQQSWRYQKLAHLPLPLRKEPPAFPWIKLSGR
jgi:hypothetical protein